MWIMGSHQEDQGEENCDHWTVVPLEARWDRGTASEDQENRWTQANWGCSIWMDSSPTGWLHWRWRSHQHRGNNDCELCPVKRKAVVSEQRLSWNFVEGFDSRQRTSC
ncbi:hypothetical protein B9Z55_000275 [Caenorhabditis nigoni]|uniref:Uncharacterized protein n=1 Tax=Caenorhabditis nigoni TaxID=1611254 RepID=A0A2G5VMG5_9PELO|nr:hypothetical protein B9Z55_000275 [Caenorhabditis nigoni]